MFEFLKLWKKENIIDESYARALKLLKRTQVMFHAVMKALEENTEPDFDLYRRDFTINLAQIDIRQKILTHLSINPKQDVNACLVLLGIINDIERIGDYTKNILEVAKLYTKQYKGGKYASQLLKYHGIVDCQFNLMIKAWEEDALDEAKTVVKMNREEINKPLKGMLRELMKEKDLNAQEAVTSALLMRYLRRISAHIMNIASSLTNPYHASHYSEETLNAFQECFSMDLSDDE